MSVHHNDVVFSRRGFLRTAIAGPLAAAVAPRQPGPSPYSILLLGDVHFDRLSHHDMTWLRREKPADVRQVENYTRLTREVWPRMLERLRSRIAAGSSAAPVAFVAQLGDLVEGLCGTPALAERQALEVLASIRDASLGTPFLFCKGNHDITGPGATEAFDRVLLPFVRSGMDRLGTTAKCFDADGANLALSHRGDWFLFFDGYEPRALAWLERVLARRTARHVFVLLHTPVVPYGARSTWVVYGRSGEAADRQRLLNLLGHNRAFVLTGHIHKHAVVVRATDRGPFVQVALCSVVPAPAVPASLQLTGVAAYTPDQVRVEPSFSPENEADRRAVLAAEAPHIRAFEYGDVPGYASIAIGPQVRVDFFAGLATEPWRSIDLAGIRDASAATAAHRVS